MDRVIEPFDPGALESEPDARDYLLELPLEAKQPARFVCTGLGPLLDQGSSPMCVAYASTGAKQWEEKRDGHGVLPFDPKWLYGRCKALDGNSTPGTTGRQAMRVLKAQGEALVGSTTPVQPIAAYYAVPVSVAAIKAALRAYGPLVVGGAWYASWFRPTRGVLPAPGGGIAGGHEVLVFGWDDAVGGGSLLVRNSWGKYAGSTNGNFYAPYRVYVPSLWEAWKALDRKGD